MSQSYRSRRRGRRYSGTALTAGLVGSIFMLFATGSCLFALQAPVASASSQAPPLTLVSKHAKVTNGVAAVTVKADRSFKGTLKLVAGASPGATKTILYSKAVAVKLAAHAKKTVKLTLNAAGLKYLATAKPPVPMLLVATPGGGAPSPVDIVFLSS